MKIEVLYSRFMAPTCILIKNTHFPSPGKQECLMEEYPPLEANDLGVTVRDWSGEVLFIPSREQPHFSRQNLQGRTFRLDAVVHYFEREERRVRVKGFQWQ